MGWNIGLLGKNIAKVKRGKREMQKGEAAPKFNGARHGPLLALQARAPVSTRGTEAPESPSFCPGLRDKPTISKQLTNLRRDKIDVFCRQKTRFDTVGQNGHNSKSKRRNELTRQ
jgi:hypothetical protein